GLVTAYLSPPIRLVIQRRGLHPQPAVRELLRPQMMPVSADEDAGRAERFPPERLLAPPLGDRVGVAGRVTVRQAHKRSGHVDRDRGPPLSRVSELHVPVG